MEPIQTVDTTAAATAQGVSMGSMEGVEEAGEPVDPDVRPAASFYIEDVEPESEAAPADGAGGVAPRVAGSATAEPIESVGRGPAGPGAGATGTLEGRAAALPFAADVAALAAGASDGLMVSMAQASNSGRPAPKRRRDDGVRGQHTRVEVQEAASGSDMEDIADVPGERPRPQGEFTDTNNMDAVDGGELGTPPSRPGGWALAGGVEIWRGEVKPPQELVEWPKDWSNYYEKDELPRWNHEEGRKLVPQFDGYMSPLCHRRFEARRYRLPLGEFGTRLVVRIRLVPADGASVTEEQFSQLFQRAQSGVDERYNGGSRLPNGDLFRVDLEMVSDPHAAAHHVVHVHATSRRANYENWHPDLSPDVLAHEVGHLLGLDDEYRESHAFGARPIYQDGALMTGPMKVDGRGRPDLDVDHPSLDPSTGPDRWWLPPRHLRQLGAAVESLQGTARLRVDGGAAFYADDTLSREDGLPARAHFPVDTRTAVLYGEPGVGGGGYLPPSGISDRVRPVGLEEANPNGTYRAEYESLAPGREPGSLSRAVAPADRLDSAAGDLHVRPKQPERGQMMFPVYWTEDDAVYAAEQAYLHALREHDMLTRTPRRHPLSEKKPPTPPIVGGRGVYYWVGEYAGVRIEGELRHGSFTGFRPSDDQPDQPAPAYVPAPVSAPKAGPGSSPGFGQRVEDVARYGDRRTRTGAHHAPKPGQEYYHGMHIEPGEEHDNGTYQADVWFLDPALRYGDPRGSDPTRWILHRDGSEHVMFPNVWSPSTLLKAVEQAHAAAVAAGTYQELPGRDRTHHWVGEAGGIRIEGLVRDGQHVAYRPTQVQPHLRWPQQRPIGETAAVPVTFGSGGPQHGVDVRRVLFADGQRGLDLTARIYLAAAPGTTPAVTNLLWLFLKAKAEFVYAGITRGYGTPLVRLARVEDSRAAHHVVPVDLKPKDATPENLNGIVDGLPALLGLPTSPDALKDFARGLEQGMPAGEWLLPRGADPVEGRAAIDQALNLQVRPHRGWPQEKPTGETAAVPLTFTRGGRQYGFDVRHVLLANGQRGFDVSVRIRLEAEPGTVPARVSELWNRLRATVAEVYGGVARANGAPLVRVSLTRVEDSRAAHHVVPVRPDPKTDQETVDGLSLLLGVRPDTGEFRDFAQVLDSAAPRIGAWAVPWDADPVRGAAAITHALSLADPLSQPTTLSEPDPTARDDSPVNTDESSTSPLTPPAGSEAGPTPAAAGMAAPDGGQFDMYELDLSAEVFGLSPGSGSQDGTRSEPSVMDEEMVDDLGLSSWEMEGVAADQGHAEGWEAIGSAAAVAAALLETPRPIGAVGGVRTPGAGTGGADVAQASVAGAFAGAGPDATRSTRAVDARVESVGDGQPAARRQRLLEPNDPDGSNAASAGAGPANGSPRSLGALVESADGALPNLGELLPGEEPDVDAGAGSVGSGQRDPSAGFRARLSKAELEASRADEWPSGADASAPVLVQKLHAVLGTGVAVAGVTGSHHDLVTRYVREKTGPGFRSVGRFRAEYEALRLELLRLRQLGESFDAREWVRARSAARRVGAGSGAEPAVDVRLGQPVLSDV
ncbi:EndoU domain-containing protein, partial [Streptomyces sp. NPDC006430]|uniref:EndoU domain-containing protein n=1 Tax=Streptomyces sp. NPDC006430 TaxID=3154299 RepID=UPI0033AC7B0F